MPEKTWYVRVDPDCTLPLLAGTWVPAHATPEDLHARWADASSPMGDRSSCRTVEVRVEPGPGSWIVDWDEGADAPFVSYFRGRPHLCLKPTDSTNDRGPGRRRVVLQVVSGDVRDVLESSPRLFDVLMTGLPGGPSAPKTDADVRAAHERGFREALEQAQQRWHEGWSAALDEVWRVFTAEGPRGNRDALEIAKEISRYGRSSALEQVIECARADRPGILEPPYVAAAVKLAGRSQGHRGAIGDAMHDAGIPGDEPFASTEQLVEAIAAKTRREVLSEVLRYSGMDDDLADREPVIVAEQLLRRGIPTALGAFNETLRQERETWTVASLLDTFSHLGQAHQDTQSDLENCQAKRALDAQELADVRLALGAGRGESAVDALQNLLADVRVLREAGSRTLDQVWNTISYRPRPSRPESVAYALVWHGLADALVRLGGDPGQMPESPSSDDVEDLGRRVYRRHVEERVERARCTASESSVAHVTVWRVGDVVLRSERLARALTRLDGRPEPTETEYLVQDDRWYEQRTERPEHSLLNDIEADFVRQLYEAHDEQDTAAVVEIVRRLAAECNAQDTAQAEQSGVVHESWHVPVDRTVVVRELRPALAELRAAAGLPPLDVEPVHQHELHGQLQAVAQRISRAREATLWLASHDSGAHEHLRGRLAERGGRAFDLESLLVAWAGYWRERVSHERDLEIQAFMRRLDGQRD